MKTYNLLLRVEEQVTISIDYSNIIKDLLLLRSEEQKTISINYNIIINANIFATVRAVAKTYTLCIHNCVFWS